MNRLYCHVKANVLHILKMLKLFCFLAKTGLIFNIFKIISCVYTLILIPEPVFGGASKLYKLYLCKLFLCALKVAIFDRKSSSLVQKLISAIALTSLSAKRVQYCRGKFYYPPNLCFCDPNK